MLLATLRANLLAFVLGLAAAIFLVIAVVQGVKIHGFLGIGGLKDKIERAVRDNNELRAELKSISDQRNEQKAETSRNIAESEKRIQIADKVAERIETAPLPGNCATPPEILGADL